MKCISLWEKYCVEDNKILLKECINKEKDIETYLKDFGYEEDAIKPLIDDYLKLVIFTDKRDFDLKLSNYKLITKTDIDMSFFNDFSRDTYMEFYKKYNEIIYEFDYFLQVEFMNFGAMFLALTDTISSKEQLQLLRLIRLV